MDDFPCSFSLCVMLSYYGTIFKHEKKRDEKRNGIK